MTISTLSPSNPFPLFSSHPSSFLLYLLLLLSPFLSFAQTVPLDWENPQLTGINNEPPHATFIPFQDESTAIQNDWNKSSYYKLLNGTWKFFWSENPYKRPVDFFTEGFDTKGWKDIQVPSTIEIQGYGYPIYVNTRYEFLHLMKPNPPLVPKEYNPVGS
jgi:beta-galactosidase